MSPTKTLTDNPAYVGLLAASTGCIALLGVYLGTALLDIPFEVIVPAGVLAAIAAVFAAIAIAISEPSSSTGDDRRSIDAVSLDAAFASIDEHWSPRLAGELNGQAVKLAKGEGAFVWHHHDDADELFLVTSGKLRIEFEEDPDVTIREGEFVIVPGGIEHRPVAEEEVEILLFEPLETQNTGNVESDLTQTNVEEIEQNDATI